MADSSRENTGDSPEPIVFSFTAKRSSHFHFVLDNVGFKDRHVGTDLR